MGELRGSFFPAPLNLRAWTLSTLPPPHTQPHLPPPPPPPRQYGYGRILADTDLWDFAYAQYNSTAYGGPLGPPTQPGLWSPAHSLFFRDHTFVNQTEPNGEPVFWARGNGWAAASFVQALEQLPAAHPYAAEYRGKIVAMAAALKAAQARPGGAAWC